MKQPGCFALPKGGLERGENPEVGALRELFEEAGIKGSVLMIEQPIYVVFPERPEENCLFFWTLIEHLADEWEESHKRKRHWFKLKELSNAKLTSTSEGLAAMLEKTAMVKKIENLLLSSED